MENKARVIAAYLPQYYPIPENDIWWGKGFTEWTNVGKAKPLFKGHYQPRVPADLGYYDLRVPETRQAQADMARECGIEGFCYWHYWFGNGKRLLDRPFKEVLKSGEPDYPFCLAWANSSWQGIDYGVKGQKLLIKQEYPGLKDHEQHFYEILPALSDHRYIRVENKPLFLIFNPRHLPNPKEFIDCWQNLAVKNGLEGVYFVAQTSDLPAIDPLINEGYDSVNIIRISHPPRYGISTIQKIKRKVFRELVRYNYKDAIKFFSGPEDYSEKVIPSIFPNWDHTPRSGKKGYVLHGSTPELFKKHVEIVLKAVANKPTQKKIIYLKSWNEWAEGNYMEPDLMFGHGYLQALKECLIGS
ncbi:MAG: glycoside hydrolase family 99-like domain-containing protein [Elusimicrobia bacterium]|nr:glycoside hydrolase family 99-like domain-containing protein [Elusimicrobiota bacterium]